MFLSYFFRIFIVVYFFFFYLHVEGVVPLGSVDVPHLHRGDGQHFRAVRQLGAGLQSNYFKRYEIKDSGTSGNPAAAGNSTCIAI